MPDIVITPNRGTTSNPKIDFTGVTAGTIKLEVLADGTIAWNGANGSLFSIADSLSGSLMSVNDISGLPAFEVFSDNRVVVGQFGANLLLGTTTNSSNGRLQLTSSTASSGGIGFGTDTSLYRAGAGELRLNYNGGTTVLRFLNNSGNSSSIGMSNTYDLQLKSDGGSGQITFWPSNVLALTLSSSQAATFAGTVSAQGTGTHTFGTTNTVGLAAGSINGTNTTAGATTSLLIRNTDNTNSASSAVMQATVGGANAGDPRILLTVDAVVDWSLGVDNSDSDSFKIGPSGTVGTSTALTLTTAGAATFAGAVGLSAGTLTATNAAATQAIFKGWNSRSGANAQNGQIEIGTITGLRLMSDASGTGGSVIDDRWDNAASSILFRLRGNGTPVTALTLVGTGAATFAGAVTANGQTIINAIGSSGSPTLRLNTSTSSTFVHTQESLAANLTAGQHIISVFGKSADTKNSGYIGYTWAGNASNSNYVTIGHWGADDLFRVYGDGNVTVGANVGIGTTSPASKLHISGSSGTIISITDNTLYSNSITNANAVMTYTVDTGNAAAGSAAHIFKRYATELVRIDQNGNVGIGTTAPAYKLHVSGTGYISGALTSGGRIAATGATCELYLDSGASNSTITSYGSGVYKDLWIRTLSSSSDGVWIKADTGRVGVGVAAPSEKLEVNGNILSGNSVANNSISVTRTGANSSSLAIQAFTDSPAINWNGAGGYFRFIYGATEQMRLDSTGNVGIGTTSPSPYKLSVDQGAVVQYPINLVSSGKFVRIGALNASYAHVDTDAASGFYFYDQVETGSGNSRLGLSNQTTYFALNGGNVGIGTSAPSVLFQVSSAASGNFKLDSNGSGGHYYQAESNARLGFGRDLVTSAGHISFTMGGGSVATLGSAITMPANSQLGFYTSNGTSLVERMRLDGSGNVGIGTTNPAYKLEVSGSVADSIGNIRILPQNSRSAAYTTVLSDSGKHILHPSADTTARTFTIDSNTNVAYPIGTAITFINQNGAGVVTIAITSDTMRLAGAGTNGSRTLAANGVATAVKITSTEWIISGTGLT